MNRQLCRYLAGDPLDDVVGDLDKRVNRLASAALVRHFPVGVCLHLMPWHEIGMGGSTPPHLPFTFE
jgi:hypothetical protein